jgi:hypothetical protein
MKFEECKESSIDGKKVVEIVLFRKLGTRLYREMPLIVNTEGEKVFGESWNGLWWWLISYPPVIVN